MHTCMINHRYQSSEQKFKTFLPEEDVYCRKFVLVNFSSNTACFLSLLFLLGLQAMNTEQVFLNFFLLSLRNCTRTCISYNWSLDLKYFQISTCGLFGEKILHEVFLQNVLLWGVLSFIIVIIFYHACQVHHFLEIWGKRKPFLETDAIIVSWSTFRLPFVMPRTRQASGAQNGMAPTYVRIIQKWFKLRTLWD